MEPLLENISAIIPDEKIDRELIFPQPNRGPRHQLKPSQMYRIHLLLCLKRLASFRQLREDLLHQRDWRSFAHLKNKNHVPTLRALSEFRQRASRLIRQINQLYLKMIFSIVPSLSIIVTVPDSTDIRAATKGYEKKLFLFRFL
jgi:transposase